MDRGAEEDAPENSFQYRMVLLNLAHYDPFCFSTVLDHFLLL